jgi:hypothetical protein
VGGFLRDALRLNEVFRICTVMKVRPEFGFYRLIAHVSGERAFQIGAAPYYQSEYTPFWKEKLARSKKTVEGGNLRVIGGPGLVAGSRLLVSPALGKMPPGRSCAE